MTTNTRRGFLGTLTGLVAGMLGVGKSRAKTVPHCGGRAYPGKMPRSWHLGIIKFPPGEPVDLLPGTEVVGVSPHVCFWENLWAMKVSHPDLPEVQEAHSIPNVRNNAGTWEIL